ncbi:DUF6189 family protein [Glycomyces salinus]|uniref:DUF6189 family protein n=1 Tax=Glycomyces salinus TaxID=980294 RepID=UPI001E4DE118|nr:DUF6189 family protein [Glycomyces salinus]
MVMDENAFNRSARQIAARIAPRVPEDEFASIWQQIRGGEAQAAVMPLVALLRRHSVALTIEELGILAGLLGELDESAQQLEDLPQAPPSGKPEARELARRTHAIVERLAPKLEARWAEIIRGAAGAGEWRFAATEMAAVLASSQIEVSVADRDDLRCLVSDMDASTEDVDQLNVGPVKD